MQLFVATFFIFTSVACANDKVIEPIKDTAFGYIQKYGIPKAEQILKTEKLISNQNLDLRIIGGVPASLAQYPFQVGLIGDVVGIESRSVCGGSLLSINRVLTAAHCWNDGNNQIWKFTVVLGSTMLFSGGVRVETSVVAMHPNWTALLARNDIAVIYLPSAVTLSNKITPVTLPSGSQIFEDFVGEAAIAVGFGVTGDDAYIEPDQSLNHVRLTVITNSVCSYAFPFIIQSSHLCTSGFGGVSTCRGDSGGPLVITRDGKQILIGITSFVNILGCESNLPAAFVRVTSYLEFIDSHT